MAAPVRRTATGLDDVDTFVDAPEEQLEDIAELPQQQPAQQPLKPHMTNSEASLLVRQQLTRSGTSYNSIPPTGSILTGKQEHYLKRELVSHQSEWEVSELASPTALQRFGAPFRSDKGEVKPEDSELPLLRYVFNHHVRTFPFLDKAKEKEFWQDKLQVFLESFANKNISSSEDRLETTKRRKLAEKAEKMIELMMVSGIPTASGYEERIRFAEIEVVDRGAQEQGLVANAPKGRAINGWDVNIAGVRSIQVKKRLRHHTHAEYLLRVQQDGREEIYVGRNYDDFKNMHKRLRLEIPGKIIPPLPKRNPTDSTYHSSPYDDSDSASSTSTRDITPQDTLDPSAAASGGGLRAWIPSWGGGSSSGNNSPAGGGSSHHKRHSSNISLRSPTLGSRSPRPSLDGANRSFTLFRESQRVSLRASLRNMLQNEQIAKSTAMSEFLTKDPITLTDEEYIDTERRKEVDERRIQEQKQFYDIARQRAAELDIHMERFRRDIVESNGLTKLFQEIRVKNTIADLKPEYKKFAEWVRIEVAATIYHLFLAEDNSPELFAQGKRIHSLIPYTVLKNIVRFTNPAAVMAQVLDLFMAQPFGARSLLQRIFGMAIHDGINNIQKSIDILSTQKIQDPVLCNKIKDYITADEKVKSSLKKASIDRQEDLVLTILQSEDLGPELNPQQIEKIFGAYTAWESILETAPTNKSTEALSKVATATSAYALPDPEARKGAELFAHLKQLFKLYLRQRDKAMMLEVIEEPTTLRLFRDLFQIFYEPLVRVYKSANVYSSITDFSYFADDAIKVIEAAQRQDISADPNQTVQAFIDLCARHEDNLYKFIHEVHIHDNGLFSSLMHWVEGILDFLRKGPKGGKLDMNALFKTSTEQGVIQPAPAMREINSLIKWQMARKRWHNDKTRQKMAAEGAGHDNDDTLPGFSAFKSSDFGINEQDLQELDLGADALDSDDEDLEEEYEELDVGSDPIAMERKRREKERLKLRRSAGEPQKPEVVELNKMMPGFLEMLRNVLAE